jgi:hypothetical protein
LHQPWNVQPDINNPESFFKQLLRWWDSLQPGWRRGRSTVLPQSPDWEGLRIGGPSGIIVILISLTWCFKNFSEAAELRDMIADITWVMQECAKEDARSIMTRRSSRSSAPNRTTTTATRGVKRPSTAATSKPKRSKK